MKGSGDLFKKHNDLIEKTLKISKIKDLQKTLKTMPADFVPNYPKIQTSMHSEGDVFDFFRGRSNS
jgi:hypothetical protein